jgi:glycosyltransferase involved in cell wall biosynthesis
MDKRRVSIALCTYNGANYLRAQLASIARQTCLPSELIVCDDRSSDTTCHIVNSFAARSPFPVRFCINQTRLGAVRNFAGAIQLCEGEYIALSDQDDVWQPDKLEVMLRYVHEYESVIGRDTPILVHSDLEVVDDSLNRIHPSLMRYQGMAHEEASPLKVLLAQNFVTGCATVVNRALLEVALPIPATALMHDWWFALCAAAFGKIAYVPRATVLYRQHGANQVGAKGLWKAFNPFTNTLVKRWETGSRNFLGTLEQARSLASRIRERQGPAHAAEFAESYAALASQPRFKRLLSIQRMGVHRQNFLAQLFLCHPSMIISPSLARR